MAVRRAFMSGPPGSLPHRFKQQKKVRLTYKITEKCLECGVCVPKCPQKAIIEELYQVDFYGNPMTFHRVRIDPDICNDCGVCQSEEYWCPAQAIVEA
jgi:ferredoxin